MIKRFGQLARYVRAGDTVVIRNLPPTLSTEIDRIRIFRITRTEYDPVRNTVTVEPEAPIDSLEALLAQAQLAGTGFEGRPFIAPR